ncbi:MAG: hypothetical protein ACLRWH_02285 [Emergencia sp.]
MNKIIGFFGGDSQVGTTMLAQSFAELMGQRGKRVLLILGSGKFGEAFAHLSSRYSIDDLKAAIRSGKVGKEDLLQSVERSRHIFILPSVRNPLTAKYFPENTYEIMLSSAGEEFDYIIIDGGDDANLGLMISALNIVDVHYFVITQQPKSLHRFLLLQKNILEPMDIGGTLIVNKYLKEPALFMKKDILKLCERQALFTVPYIEYGWQAEMEGKTLLAFHRFGKAVKRIACKLEPDQKKESLWKKRFV